MTDETDGTPVSAVHNPPLGTVEQRYQPGCTCLYKQTAPRFWDLHEQDLDCPEHFPDDEDDEETYAEGWVEPGEETW